MTVAYYEITVVQNKTDSLKRNNKNRVKTHPKHNHVDLFNFFTYFNFAMI